MATCPHCSNEIDDGARFCGVCGRPITPTAADQRAAQVTGVGGPVSGRASPVAVTPPPAIVASPIPSHSAHHSGAAPLPTRPPAAAARPVPVAAPIRPATVPAAIRAAQQPLENLIGRTLNHRYIVEDKIGEGGFGAVFRGKQIATGREVALKILHPHNVSDETIVARFRREAEACSKLRDPHTVTTYDFDETPDGILYLAMEQRIGRLQ